MAGEPPAAHHTPRPLAHAVGNPVAAATTTPLEGLESSGRANPVAAATTIQPESLETVGSPTRAGERANPLAAGGQKRWGEGLGRGPQADSRAREWGDADQTRSQAAMSRLQTRMASLAAPADAAAGPTPIRGAGTRCVALPAHCGARGRACAKAAAFLRACHSASHHSRRHGWRQLHWCWCWWRQ